MDKLFTNLAAYSVEATARAVGSPPNLKGVVSLRKVEEDGIEEWKIKCKIAEVSPSITYGVLKIHPSVKESVIKTELLRNKVKVDQVVRIKKRTGNTWSVKIQFTDNVRPNKVQYAGEELKIFKYIPDVFICNRCSKPGHLEKNCNSRTLRCPLCMGPHTKYDCSSGTRDDTLKRKCANCQGNHHAKYRESPNFMKEKIIIHTMVNN